MQRNLTRLAEVSIGSACRTGGPYTNTRLMCHVAQIGVAA